MGHSLRFVVLIVLLSGFQSFGRLPIDTLQQPLPRIAYRAGIVMSSLISRFPAITISQEFIKNRWVFGLESGYIFNNEKSILYKGRQGFRLRPSIMFDFWKKDHTNWCLKLFYNYRFIRIRQEEEISKANGQYTELVRGHNDKTLNGLGLMLYRSIRYDHLILNAGFGLTLGSLNNKYSNEVRTNRGNDFFFINTFDDPGSQIIPGFLMHYSLLYEFPIKS